MSDQLKSTLSYRPPQPATPYIMSDVEAAVETLDLNISTALSNLSDNLPSDVISKADIAITKVNAVKSYIEANLKDNISNDVSFSDYQAALDDDDYEVIEAFEGGHRESLTGDPAGELYGTLYYLTKDLEDSRSMVMVNNYDDDVNSDNIAAMDSQMLSHMITIEQTEDDTGIQVNYDAVYLDTIINSTMGSYFTNSGNFADSVLSIVDASPEQETAVSDDEIEVVKSLTEDAFISGNTLNLKDVQKVRQLDRSSIRLQVQSMMYDKRNTSIGDSPSSGIANITNSTLKQTLQDQIDNRSAAAKNAVLDVFKMNKMEKMYRGDLLSSVEDKQQLRNFHGIL